MYLMSLIKMIASIFPFIENDFQKTEDQLVFCLINGDEKSCEEITDFFKDFLEARDCHKESKDYSKHACGKNKKCREEKYDKHYERCEKNNREDSERFHKSVREASKNIGNKENKEDKEDSK